MYLAAQPGGLANFSYSMVEQHKADIADDDDDDALDNHAQASPDIADDDDDDDDDAGKENEVLGSQNLHVAVVVAARWAISGLLLCLIPTLIALFFLNSHVAGAHSDPGAAAISPKTTSTILAVTFFAFLSFSFLGRWTYDLAITQLTQMLIPAESRSSFGGTEQAIVSCVSLVHWVAAAVWHHQSDFVWLALGSVCAVAAATGAFALWARWWSSSTDRGSTVGMR